MLQEVDFLEGQADLTKMMGTVVRNPITAGQPITQGSLVAPGDRGFLAAALGPGMRAVTITVSQKTGVAGFIFPGDHVDLLLTSSVKAQDGDDDQALKTTETILRNLRVLATDQATNTEVVDGKSIVRTSKTVTIEVTPRIAEKIQVAETLGTLSLSLRSLADNQADLERAIASGSLKIPAGASKLDEDRLLTQAMNHPIEGATSFVTGGDVSRFARRTIPVTKTTTVAVAGGGSPRADIQALGPVVRVTRGKDTVAVPVGR
jgi:pilus assembly protein CpaB